MVMATRAQAARDQAPRLFGTPMRCDRAGMQDMVHDKGTAPYFATDGLWRAIERRPSAMGCIVQAVLHFSPACSLS